MKLPHLWPELIRVVHHHIFYILYICFQIIIIHKTFFHCFNFSFLLFLSSCRTRFVDISAPSSLVVGLSFKEMVSHTGSTDMMGSLVSFGVGQKNWKLPASSKSIYTKRLCERKEEYSSHIVFHNCFKYFSKPCRFVLSLHFSFLWLLFHFKIFPPICHIFLILRPGFDAGEDTGVSRSAGKLGFIGAS